MQEPNGSVVVEQKQDVPVHKAAARIQRFWRQGSQKKLELVNPLIWMHSLGELEKEDEKKAQEEEKEIEEMLIVLQETPADVRKKKVEAVNLHIVPEHYHGPHLFGEMTMKFITDIIAFFREGGNLPYLYVEAIISRVFELHDSCQPVIDLEVPHDGRLTVVGDIHGQLADLLTIFQHNGLPSETNAYIFNGDFVDRGKQGTEVLLILYSLKLLLPQYVHLNKGNHEQLHMNKKYGFEDEVRKKYSDAMYALIAKSFSVLPLAVVLCKDILITHGGLFADDDICIDDIRTIKRKGLTTMTSRVMQDLLWSDPSANPGKSPSARGAGILFGPDVTERFIKNNNLRMIIRSHELKGESGYFTMHNNQLITVFSASNYCGTNNNTGAFLVFNHNSVKGEKLAETYQVHEFRADPDLGSHVFSHKELKKQTKEKLRDKIYRHRHDLMICFSNFDEDGDGYITKVQWAEALNSVLCLSIPWLALFPYFIKASKDNKSINYTQFVRRFRMPCASFPIEIVTTAIDKICTQMILEGASEDIVHQFSKFDANGDGKMTYVEFAEAIEKFNVVLTKDQIFNLMELLDSEGNGTVEPAQFVELFQDPFYRTQEKLQSQLNAMIEEISHHLYSTYGSLPKAYEAIDKHKKGILKYKSFAKKLKKIGHHFSFQHRITLAKYIDHQREGYISKEQFCAAFEKKNLDWKDNILHQIRHALYHKSYHLETAFKALDTEGKGVISFSDFHRALLTLIPT
eukprot:TRINITY_DN8111_c0_g1_i1.p1 TRINITY_DN8111_c0_g1~~TRINITY_DN8111_c0_g1_i1.p1  ORF type:complete len:755 (+),score=222.45 TRINITY_DN8111_c0_g1_i1:39-2267(+)